MQRTSPLSTAIECDVAKLDQVREMVTGVLSKFGKIDILINNAGIGMRKPFAETPIDVIEELMRTNYLGAVYCTHEALPSMIARGSGHIVNISSVAGKIGALNIAGYCASKFAMNGLSESLYYELTPLGIDVSVDLPRSGANGLQQIVRRHAAKVSRFVGRQPGICLSSGNQGHRGQALRSRAAALVGVDLLV